MRMLLLMVALVAILPAASAQKSLVLEKSGDANTRKFFVGDELRFRLKGKDQPWRREAIKDLLVEEKIVVFDNGMAKLDDIAALRKYRRWPVAISASLYSFAAGWTVFSTLGILAGNVITVFDGIVVGTALLSGWLVRKIFHRRTYPLGSNYQLRIVDLTFYPQTP